MVGTIYYNIYLGSSGTSSRIITGNDCFIYEVTGIQSSIPSGSSIGSISSITLHFNKLQNYYQQVEFMLYDNNGEWYNEWMADRDGDLVTIQKNSDNSYDYAFTRINPAKSQVRFNVGHMGAIHFLPEGSTVAFELSDSTCKEGYIAISYNYTPPAPSSGSSISLASNTITLGGALTYSITGDSRCTHTVTASLNNTQLYVQQTGVGTGQGQTITIPNSQQDLQQWLNALSNSVIGNCTISLTTYYNGSQIGSTSTAFYVRVPDSYVPTITGLGISMITSPYNDTVTRWGLYVQGISKAHLVATGASGSGGSTIRAYHFLKPDGTEIANISANSYDATLPTSAGTSFSTQFKCYVEDSRGKTSNTVSSSDITVYNYSIPTISAMSAIRCNSAGVTKEDGTYFKVSFIASFSSIGGKNLTNCTYQVQWKELNASTWRSASTESITFDTGATSKSLSMTIGSDSEQSADYIVPETDYLIKVTIRDTLGQPAEKQVELGTISYTMFFKKGGQGVAIGQPTQEESAAFEVNPDWQMIWGRIAGSRVRIPGVYVGDTEPPAKAGLIWLKPAT